jgi:hypothetical protein
LADESKPHGGKPLSDAPEIVVLDEITTFRDKP